jgi:integrase
MRLTSEGREAKRPVDEPSPGRPAGPSTARPVEPSKKQSHKDAVYVYQRTSPHTGAVSWWCDLRRFKDVGGRLERLAPYLLPGEEPIIDGEQARIIYWRAVGVYLAKRRAAARAEATDAPADSAGAVAPLASTAGDTRPRPSAPADTGAPASGHSAATLAEIATVVSHALSAAGIGASPVAGAHLTLRRASEAHLKWKRAQATIGNGRDSTCDTDETSFKSLWRILGADRLLKDITVKVLEDYITTRLGESGWKAGSTISTATVRNEMHALSSLFTQFTHRGEYALPNPVSHVRLPAPPSDESEYLQLEELARFLDAAVLIDIETATAVKAMSLVTTAREMGARGQKRPVAAQALLDQAEQMYPTAVRGEGWHRRFASVEAFMATLAYTGPRSEEGRGLQAEEIDWARHEVVYRNNDSRALKRTQSVRRVPMPEEYRRILRHYQTATGITSGLLFRGVGGGMLGGLQTIFPRCVQHARIDRDIVPHSLRHTYATAMLHTYMETPDGHKVQRSAHNVAKLLGQKDSRLVDQTYGHLLWDAGMMRDLEVDALRRFPSTRLAGGITP